MADAPSRGAASSICFSSNSRARRLRFAVLLKAVLDVRTSVQFFYEALSCLGFLLVPPDSGNESVQTGWTFCIQFTLGLLHVHQAIPVHVPVSLGRSPKACRRVRSNCEACPVIQQTRSLKATRGRHRTSRILPPTSQNGRAWQCKRKSAR